jgi:hypothetical protein
MPRVNVAVDKESWDNKFILLPPGEYTLKYEKVVAGESSQKKSPELQCTLGIVAPASVTAEGKEVNISKQKVFDRISMVPKAAGFLRDKLVGANVPFKLDPSTGMCDFDTDDFIGKAVVARIEVEVGTDNVPRNKIRSTKPLA